MTLPAESKPPPCPTCGAAMKPLWGAKWFCVQECDLPLAKRSKQNPAPVDNFFPIDWDEAPTNPGWSAPKCPKCGSANTDQFTTMVGGKCHCWDCGGVW